MFPTLLPDTTLRRAPTRAVRVLTDAAVLLLLLGELCAFALIFPGSIPTPRAASAPPRRAALAGPAAP